MTVKQLNFTRASLENLSASTKQYEVADTRIPGLRLRINPGNSRTYFLLKKINNQVKRIKICRYHEFSVDEVRTKAIKLSAMIVDGIDPQEEKNKSRSEPTFNDVFKTYYELHSLKFNKDPEHNKRIIDFHVTPVFGNKKISTITAENLRRLHHKIGEKRGKITANRVMTVVQASFNFYIKNGYWNGTNPCYGLKKFSEYSRDRFLNFEEIQSFFEALGKEDLIFQDFFKLALYTGVRKSNLLSMKYSDIDFIIKRWRIPETQTKNRDINIVMLSEPALEILARRKNTNDETETPSKFVFPGEGKSGYLKDPKRSFDRIRERMKITDLRIHDLRRTLGSYMAIRGFSLPIIGKALNHKNLNSTAIYARLSYTPVLDAVNTTAEMILGLIGNETVSPPMYLNKFNNREIK